MPNANSPQSEFKTFCTFYGNWLLLFLLQFLILFNNYLKLSQT
jgi:hypothetical protein